MKLSLSVFAVCAAALAFAEPTVSNVHVRPRWPFSAKVDVIYELSGADRVVDIAVTATSAGAPLEIKNKALEGEYLSVGNGRHVFTWDPAANGFAADVKKVDGLVFSLAPTMEKRYMIVDLDPNLAKTAAARVSYTNEVVGTGTDAAGGRAWDDAYKTTKMVFRRCPAGEYTMGSPSTEKYRQSVEVQRQVRISRPFYIGVFELTQGQVKLFYSSDAAACCYFTGYDTRPADKLSFERAGWACDALKKYCSGIGFRLPSEAQWEYACRAGTTTGYYNGDWSNINEFQKLGHEIGNVWRDCAHKKYDGTAGTPDIDPEQGGTMPVGSFTPNPWGIYDMIGNVQEYCRGWYWPDYDGLLYLIDPESKEYKDSSGFVRRVSRGGCYSYGHTNDSYSYTTWYLRTAARPALYTWITAPLADGVDGVRFIAPAD